MKLRKGSLRAVREQQFCFCEISAHDPGGKARWPMPPGWKVSAEFGGDGNCYRYNLFHSWGAGTGLAMWCLMNPSTADHRSLDPTVSKTARISRRLGYDGQFIANACAYRTTDRMRLLDVADPVGPNNAACILAMARESGIIVIAHGRLPGDLQKHADAMCRLLRDAGHSHKLHVLRLTDDGVPMHPLARGKRHIPEDVVPQPWNCQ